MRQAGPEPLRGACPGPAFWTSTVHCHGWRHAPQLWGSACGIAGLAMQNSQRRGLLIPEMVVSISKHGGQPFQVASSTCSDIDSTSFWSLLGPTGSAHPPTFNAPLLVRFKTAVVARGCGYGEITLLRIHKVLTMYNTLWLSPLLLSQMMDPYSVQGRGFMQAHRSQFPLSVTIP